MDNQLNKFDSVEKYIKYLKARKSIKKIPIEDFDELLGELGGKIPKKFVRCRGDYLKDMYYDIVSGNGNNYITCVDNLLHNEKISLEEFEKTRFSIMIKEPDRDAYNVNYKATEAERAIMSELVCSRVANIMGVKTEYVAPIKDNPYACIIVDFLQDKESIEEFSEFTKAKPSSYLSGFDISNWISPLVNETFFRIPNSLTNPECVKSTVYPMVRDFAKQYLFKKYIVHDADLCGVNIGIISTPNGEMKMSPAYDFEQCLLPGIRTTQGQGLEQDIRYLGTIYPEILEEIACDFNLDDEKKSKIKNVIESYCSSPSAQEEYYQLIENSSFNFVSQANEFLNPTSIIDLI